ncbi:MAG TPA: hypothetical protein VHU80_24880 [Polyangiaceae bacterium]|nr:hypothetical protein [Polyangiaceae bacterium]
MVVFASLVMACNDPVRNTQLNELGDEAETVPAGPLHRPGQPCLACHGGEGPADGAFALAGTVYQASNDAKPLHDATVRLIDSVGAEYAVVSNCAGNFWASADNFRPAWPVWTKIEYGSESVEMTSAMFREGSCGECHADPATPRSVGHLYFADETRSFSQEPCK